jgi:hypothetical protein
VASLPDFLLRDKKKFLEMLAAPTPFTELKAANHDGDHGEQYRGFPKPVLPAELLERAS